MVSLHGAPLDQSFSQWWERLDSAYKKAFFTLLLVNLLAFGFRMANLTIHHDDVWQIFIEDDIIGYYLGRFATGSFHYYTQGAHIMPFLQMAQGMVVMTLYGLLVARLWGLEKTTDIVLVASILCVFPYMAQVNQYNALTVPYSIAHFLAAAAIALSLRAGPLNLALAAALYVGAFLFYQSVVANAATIFVVYVLSTLLFTGSTGSSFLRDITKSMTRVVIAGAAGGLLYIVIVLLVGVRPDSYQATGEAFSLHRSTSILGDLSVIAKGTRSFFLYPENYFPAALKWLQLALLIGAGVVCVWLPDRVWKKAVALLLLSASLFSPRLLQFMHPAGDFHNLTLTAYAVTVAGFVMLLVRGGDVLTKNLSSIVVIFLLWGYLVQANWISTVNYLNTLAHYTAMTQILARARALTDADWDGKRVVVIGSYQMPSRYPYRPATGVATNYIDHEHFANLARLLRTDIVVLPSEEVPKASKYAAAHPAWPQPGSVGVVDGVAVIVLSNEHP